MNNKIRSIVGTILVLIIAFCAIFIVSKKTRGLGWLDTTENKLYSLTEGTKSILNKLDQKLTVRLFYAQEAANRTNYDALLAYNNYYFYVRDVLRAYERQAKNKLVVVELDPRAYSDAEAEADRLQLQRFPITERDGFYFGMSIESESGGSAQNLKWLDPSEQSLLEYKISEAIDLSTKTKKNKIGVLASLSITGGGTSDYMRQMMQMQGRQAEQPWVISEDLRRQFEVADVAADVDAIPPDIDFLVVVHPKALAEKTVYAIDQFVVKGGKAMFFVDPFCMQDKPPRDPNNPFGGGGASQSSSLEKLLNAWGVSVEEGKFAGDLAFASPVPVGRRQEPFAGFLNFQGDAFNQSEAASQGLKDVLMFLPGAIRKKDGAGTEVTPLITTTQTGNVWTAQSFELGGGPMGPDWGQLATKFQPGVEKVCTAARITGKFKSAFERKPGSEEPKPENGDAKKDAPAVDQDPLKDGDKLAAGDKAAGDKIAEPKKEDHVKESTESSTVFVVADVDMITDQFAYQRNFIGYAPRGSNKDFVQNCIEQLSGSTDLISIRSRGTFNRPMTAVTEIERQADLRTRNQVMRINADIQKVRDELSQLDNKATEKNVGMLQAEAIEKQRALQAEVKKKEREIRSVQEEKLAEVEALGSFWKNITRALVPLIVLAIGIVLGVRRYNVRKVTVLGGVS